MLFLFHYIKVSFPIPYLFSCFCFCVCNQIRCIDGNIFTFNFVDVPVKRLGTVAFLISLKNKVYLSFDQQS